MLIETALPAAAIAILDLVTANCIDLLLAPLGRGHEELLATKRLLGALRRQPRGGRGGHHRGIAGATKGLSNLLTGGAPGGRLANTLNGVAHAGLLGASVARGALFYPWIIGVGTSFVANWASLVYAAQKCELPGAGYKSGPCGNLVGSHPHEAQLLLPRLELPCVASAGLGITVAPGCYATISVVGNWENVVIPGGPVSVECWIEEIHTGERSSVSSTDDSNPQWTGTGAGFRTRASQYMAGSAYTVKYKDNIGGAQIKGGILELSAYGRPVQFHPTGCIKPIFPQGGDFWNNVNPFS